MKASSIGLVMSCVLLLIPRCGLAVEPDRPLRLTTFQCDLTPPIGGHPLIWVIPVAEVETPLLAKGLVLDDGQLRCVLCAVDWCGLCNSTHELFRRKIAEAANVEPSNVAVQCVHQHTAPYTDGDAQRLLNTCEKPPKAVDFDFLEEATDRLATAVKESLDRFKPFDSIGIGEAKVDRVASSRRIPIGEGKIRGRMSGTTDPTLHAMPEGLIDPILKTITFARSDKPLVRMHYYATHPQTFYGDPRASSDMPGFARRRLEEKEGLFQIYFTGCSGDVAMGKYNDRSRKARDELTDRLYAGMEAAIAATRFSPADTLRWKTRPLRLPVRDGPGWSTENHRKTMADTSANAIARVRAAARLAFTNRIEQPIDVSLLEIGSARILHLPGECMVEFQLFAQRESPNDFIAVAAYGDLGPGYICTERAFTEGGYEPSASRADSTSEQVLKQTIHKLLQTD